MYHQFNIQQFYVLPTHTVFMCFVWIWGQTAIISLYNINWLVCIKETQSVYCAVRTGYLYIIEVDRSLERFNHVSSYKADCYSKRRVPCTFILITRYNSEVCFRRRLFYLRQQSRQCLTPNWSSVRARLGPVEIRISLPLTVNRTTPCSVQLIAAPLH